VGALYCEGVLLAEHHRYRDAIGRWQRVIELEPAGRFARRARRDARTAVDLEHILGARALAQDTPPQGAAPTGRATPPSGAYGTRATARSAPAVARGGGGR
jgi:hypothetical protein